jgi:hypothetical protein
VCAWPGARDVTRTQSSDANMHVGGEIKECDSSLSARTLPITDYAQLFGVVRAVTVLAYKE